MAYQIFLYDENNSTKQAELNISKTGIMDLIFAELTDDLEGQITLNFRQNPKSEKISLISTMKWIRVIDLDDNSEMSFRIEELQDIRSGGVLQAIWIAEHVRYLLRDSIVQGYHPFVGATPAVILNTALENTDFTVDQVDYTDSINITLDWPVVLDALESLRNVTGGYLVMTEDKKVSLKSSIGSDTGMRIEFGRNMTGITKRIDTKSVANRIYPRGTLEEGVRFSPEGYSGNPGYVEDATAQADLGGSGDPVIKEASLRDDRLLNIINLAQTPNFSGTYTAGLCEDYQDIGVGSPTFEENTNLTYLKFGYKSQKVTGDADGAGIKQDLTLVNGNYYSAFFWVYVVSGSVKIRINKGATFSPYATTSGTGFIFLEIEGQQADGTNGGFEIAQNGATQAVWYCNAVQFINHTENKGRDGLVIGDNRANLIALGNRELDLRKDPKITYDINFKDLYALDKVEWPFDAFKKGDTLTVRDEELGIDVKLVAESKNIDLINAQDVTVRFGPKKKDLSNIFRLISKRTGINFNQEIFF